MKLKDIIIEEIVDITTKSLGLTAAILFTSGFVISLTGVTGKAIEKASQAFKPFQSNLQPMIVYGTSSAFLGLLVGSTSLLITKATDKYLDTSKLDYLIGNDLINNRELESQEDLNINNVLGDFSNFESRELNDFDVTASLVINKPEQCNGCLFYCENDYLHCAVNPTLSEGCQHFMKEFNPL
jgi:hypothetical protein